MKDRLLSIALSLCIIISLIPVTTFSSNAESRSYVKSTFQAGNPNNDYLELHINPIDFPVTPDPDDNYLSAGMYLTVYIYNTSDESTPVTSINFSLGADDFDHSWISYNDGYVDIGYDATSNILIAPFGHKDDQEFPPGNYRFDLGYRAGSTSSTDPSLVGFTLVSSNTLYVAPKSLTTDAQRVELDKAALTWDTIRGANLIQTEVTTDLATLPTSGASGTTITWSSNKSFVVSSNGVVMRPDYGDADEHVILMATVSKGTASDTVIFNLTVKAVDKPETAEMPTIVIPPVDVTAYVNEAVTLSVLADVSNGKLSYQWYSSKTKTNATGELINGAINASYSVSTTTVGTQYYYCVITNTDGDKTAKIACNPVQVTVSAAHTIPAAITNLTTIAGNAQATLSWTAPNNGGATITAYQYRQRTGTGSWGTWTSAGTGTSRTVTGLANGTSYGFQVRAVNVVGNAGASNTATVVPRTVPTAITNLSAAAGNKQVTLSWAAPNNGGSPITVYQYRQRIGTGSWGSWISAGSGTLRTVTGLTNGKSYGFQVRALNAAGNASVSNTVSAIPINALSYFTASGSHATLQMKYVNKNTDLTNDALKKAFIQDLLSTQNVDENTYNGIFNLLFRSHYRPDSFGGHVASHPWPFPNAGPDGKIITAKASNLNVDVNWGYAVRGCNAYAYFVGTYILNQKFPQAGVSSSTFKAATMYNSHYSTVNAANVRAFLNTHAKTSYHIRWGKDGEGTRHSIVYLAESADGNGFYYLSHAGGTTDLRLAYSTYNQFATLTTSFKSTVRIFKPPSSDLKARTIRIVAKCPVEMIISLNGEELNSATNILSAGFGSMTISETPNGRMIEATIDYNEFYNVQITGTDDGAMDFSVQYDDNEDIKSFVQVPITADTSITTSNFCADAGMALIVSKGDARGVWYSDIEPAYAPGDDLYDFTQTEDDETTSDPGSKPSPSGGGSNTSRTVATVNDAENGTVAISPKAPTKGDAVTITATPDAGYMLESVTITDKDGKTITYTKNSDGSFTFTMLDSSVTIDASFAKISWSNPFADVSSADWFYDAVKYAFENGIMQGTSDTTFAPNANLTRAMMVQILYNLENKPDAGTPTFADVANGTWYADAIAWGASNRIVNGIGNNLFAPDQNVTREEMAVMLYNYCTYKEIELPTTRTISSFADANAISDWAKNAVDAMYKAGILNGKGNNTFDPQGTATRAEVAQMFMNFMEAMK